MNQDDVCAILYDDLIEDDNEEEEKMGGGESMNLPTLTNEVQEPNSDAKQTQDQVEKLKQGNDRLRSRLVKMKQENDRLRNNISRLYVTAKQEIEKRDLKIRELTEMQQQ